MATAERWNSKCQERRGGRRDSEDANVRMAGAGNARAGRCRDTEAPKRQEGRRQERWAPGTRNAKDGMCPGMTADLVHLWQMLGSATLASSESGTIQRHWDPQERLGLGLYLFLKTNLVYIFNWNVFFFNSADPDFN